MLFTPDAWLALGAVVLMGAIVIGVSISVGKWIICMFGTETEAGTLTHRAEEAEKLIIRDAA